MRRERARSARGIDLAKTERMQLRHRFSLLMLTMSVPLGLTLTVKDAHAAEDEAQLSFGMGFLAGGRDYASAPFALQDGPGNRYLGADTREPFTASGMFNRVSVYGLRYDTRLVVSGVRMTAGFDFPFASLGSEQTTIGGATHTLSVTSLRPYELRFGIGYEYPLGRFVPFVDVLGGVHWTSANLQIDGQSLSYNATSFAFSTRAGVRVDLRKAFFLSLAGELGLYGDVGWGTELMVGFKTY